MSHDEVWLDPAGPLHVFGAAGTSHPLWYSPVQIMTGAPVDCLFSPTTANVTSSNSPNLSSKYLGIFYQAK